MRNGLRSVGQGTRRGRDGRGTLHQAHARRSATRSPPVLAANRSVPPTTPAADIRRLTPSADASLAGTYTLTFEDFPSHPVQHLTRGPHGILRPSRREDPPSGERGSRLEHKVVGRGEPWLAWLQRRRVSGLQQYSGLDGTLKHHPQPHPLRTLHSACNNGESFPSCISSLGEYSQDLCLRVNRSAE